MVFDHHIVVATSPQRVWAFLWDVEQVARCIPGCESVKTVEPGVRYQAVVGERVGPFKVRFPLDIDIVEALEPVRLRAKAVGRDNAVGSAMQLGLDLEIVPSGEATDLRLQATVTVLGKLAALGHSMIARKADEVIMKFAQALRRELEKLEPDAPTV